MVPDEVLIYSPVMQQCVEIDTDTLMDSSGTCAEEECNNNALVNNRIFRDHFTQNFQDTGLQPAKPKGRSLK